MDARGRERGCTAPLGPRTLSVVGGRCAACLVAHLYHLLPPPQLRQRTSQYIDWILKDLEPWHDSGISEDLIGYTAALGDICEGPMAHIQISHGALWVNQINTGNKTSVKILFFGGGR